MNARSLSAIVQYAQDPAAMVAFYRDVLGLPFEAASHGAEGLHHECMVGKTHFAIWQPNHGMRAGAMVPVFSVRDVFQAVADVRRRGVPVLHEPLDIGEGKTVVTLLDPEGKPLRFIQVRDQGGQAG
jgi:predicted enzyme related to lactoylglutathione lyase